MIKIKYWYFLKVPNRMPIREYKKGTFKSFYAFKMFFKNTFEKKGYVLEGYEQYFDNQLDLFKNFN